jgi:transposase
VTVINPLQVAAYRRSGIRKVKTDTTDAFWIADFLRIANLRPTDRDVPVILQLRELSRFRFWLTDQIGDCKHKILCILDRVFPEYETLSPRPRPFRTRLGSRSAWASWSMLRASRWTACCNRLTSFRSRLLSSTMPWPN